MFITYFRSSSFNGWDVCQQQYFCTYVLGLYNPSGKAAEKGTIVHKVMECLGHGKLALQNGETEFIDDSLGTYKITKSILWDPEFFSRLLLDAYNYYSDKNKTVNTFIKRDFLDCEKWANTVPLQCGGAFDPRNRQILAVEPHFDIDIDEDWARYDFEMPDGSRLKGNLAIKGTIDLVTLAKEDVVETIDWKTGRRINWANMEEKTYEKLSDDPQLSIYHYALQKLYPRYDHFAMTINYIKDGGPFTMFYGPEQNVETLRILRNRFEEIKRALRPRLRTGFFCSRVCYFGKTQHKKDPSKTICKYIHDKIRKCGLTQTIRDETKEGFSLGFYQNPGT